MTRAERYAWSSLVGLGVAYWWFQMRLLGDGWTIADQSAGDLLYAYFVTIGLSSVAEIIINAGIVRGKRLVDERDYAIDSRANQVERGFIIVAINVLVWQALWEGAMQGHIFPRIDLGHLPTLVFWLITVLFAGEGLKRLATILLYRLQAGRA